MPVHSSSDIVVEICRAQTANGLQVVIGATINYWQAQGFPHAQVTWSTPSAGIYGAFVRTAPTGHPAQLAHDLTNEYTAVVLMSG